MDRNATSAIATFFLVAGILLGVNFMVAQEPDNGWLGWMLLFLGAAAAIWWWMRRDETARQNAENAANQAINDAEQGFSKIAEKVETSKVSPSVTASPPASTQTEAAETTAVEAAAPEPAQAPPEPEASGRAPEEEARYEPETEVEPEPEPAASPTLENAVDESEEGIDTLRGATAQVEVEHDDLTRVEGIGPKYRDALIAGGITTFAQLAALSQTEIEGIISAAGMRRASSMSTWSEQAELAAKSDWDGLSKLQSNLSAGRRS